MKADLLTVQTFLVSAICRDTPTPQDPEMSELAAEFVTGNSRISAAEQINIYRKQFFLRLEFVLRQDFPGLCAILGSAAAQVFFRRYLAAHPPSTPTFGPLALDVPSFAENYPDFPPLRRDLIVDMARYERYLAALVDGPDAPPLDPAKLAAMTEDDWSRARLVLHPLLTRLSLSYPVHLLRIAIKDQKEYVLPDAPSPLHLLLFRQDLIPRYEEVSPEAFAIVGAIGEGMPLVPALEHVASALPTERQEYVMANIGAWFRSWTAWGIIVDIVRNG